MNEFNIKNGFISNANSFITGNLTVSSGLTATTFGLLTAPTTNTNTTDVLVRNQSTGVIEKRSVTSLTNVVNLITVGLTGSTGVNYNSIKAAVDSIIGATSANTYVVSVGPGVFYEDTITMKSYVDVIGASETNTIIQANNPNVPLILGADQSMVSDVQIQGCTGTSVAAVVYSSATTPQLNAIFYVENVRFGANYTHAKTVGTGGGNCIMQCSNVKYGGYPFTVGFYVTNDGSGIGRMQLRNVTSTNGGVTTTTGLIFAKADQPNCAFIVNGCLLTKATGTAAGTGFWVENGASLRLTAVNFQRWATGIYAPQTGSAPSIEAIALNFEGCDTDVNIIHSGAIGKVQGTDTYAKTLININAPLYEVNQDPRIISVAKKGGDFSSVKSAVDSITGSSANNRFLVSVGPGKFTEGLIDLSNKPYVSIEGSNILTTEIIPSGNTQHIIKIGKDNEISFLSLSGAASGYAGIYAYDIGDYGQAHKVSFVDCDTNLWVESNTIETIFYGEYLDFNGTYTYGVKVVGNNGIKSLANVENYYNFPSGTNITTCNYATGSGATLNVFVGDNASNGVSGSTAFLIQDGAQLNTSTITVDGFTYGIRNPNAGLPIRFDVDNASFVDCEWDLYVENPSTFGTFNGSSNHEKLYTASENVYWGFLDINDGEFDITRKISVTFPDGSHTDLSTLVFGGGTMGLISGGTLTNTTGTIIQTAAGFGYLEKSDNSGIVRRIDWVNSQITLSANTNNYLFINENSVLSSSGTLPLTVNNIILGRVVTDSTTVRFIDLSPVNADHTSNRYATFFREALGPVYAIGSIVTENTTPFHIDVTAGEYYFSSSEFLPSGGTDLSFTQYYRDGIGGWNVSATTVVNNSYYDGNGSLSALTSGYYTKHTLYTVGTGSYEKYFLVLGQNEYATLVETENALLPTPPSFFNDGVTQIANIYIKQGFSGITEFEDIRPVIGFKAGGVNASSLHANLLGLSADDHTQYLLASGSRAMSGNLNMGTNNITSVGTINSIDISSHGSRHLPNGTDALATAAPISVSTTNNIGIADSFSRSDHQHALGSNIINDSNISAHTSTKITITNKSLLNSNIVYTDQINNGVTATTLSATTIIGNNISGVTTYSNTLNLGNTVITSAQTRTLNIIGTDANIRILRIDPTLNNDPSVEFIAKTSATAADSAYWDIYTDGATDSLRFRNRTTGLNSDRLVLASGTSGNVGIGLLTPTEKLHVSGNTLIEGNLTLSSATNTRLGINTSPSYTLDILGQNGDTRLFYNDTTKIQNLTLSGASDGVYSMVVDGNNIGGIRVGVVGQSYTGVTNFGRTGDSFVYSSVVSNGLNIISANGTGTDDYIRFYAGKSTASLPDLHIQGSGATNGYIGINTITPTERLHVNGNTLINGDLILSSTTNSRLGINKSPTRTFDLLSQDGTSSLVYYDSTNNHTLYLNGGSAGLYYLGVEGTNIGGLTFGVIGKSATGVTTYGVTGDSYIYSSVQSNGLNIISAGGTGTSDHIGFYAGKGASSSPDLYIKGSGATKGYIGINTVNPTERLHVSGNVLITDNLIVSGDTTVYGALSATTVSGDGSGLYNLPFNYGLATAISNFNFLT